MLNNFSIILSIILLMSNCSNKQDASFTIDYEKYQLDNGLNVVLHEDHSDPLVAIATIVHVGSNREKPGRTGFAHFFEHMSFNDSENVPRGANRKLISELGGTRNGGTWSDGTMYYEVVPKDALEKLVDLLKEASKRPKSRKYTSPTKSSIKKRLKNKRIQSLKKKDRRKIDPSDE